MQHSSHPPHEVYAKFHLGVKNGHREGAQREQALFGHCILHKGGIESVRQTGFTQFSVGSEGEDSIVPLLLDIYKNGGVGRLPFGHSDHCPAFLIDKAEVKDSDQDVRVGICVIVEQDGKILLTRRARHMKTFPWKWVFPGGHVNKGETLEEAGARELMEEAGITVKTDDMEAFACWESCYPTYLEMGKMVRQHLVVYYRATLRQEEPIRFDPGEVDAAAWLTREQVKKVLAGDEEDKAELFNTIVAQAGGADEGQVRFAESQQPLGSLMDNEAAERVEGGAVVESLSLGTIFVLKSWIALKEGRGL